MAWVLALLIGYLLGSIPVAVLVGRRHGIDPRKTGDANPGYWNVQTQLGVRAALPVFIGDALKGAAAAGAGWLIGGTWVGFAALASAMIGHAWPLFARFRGGRSILTFAGGVCVLTPVAALIAIGICVVVSLVSRRFAWGVRAGVFAYPAIALVVNGWTTAWVAFACMSIIGLRFLLAAWTQRAS